MSRIFDHDEPVEGVPDGAYYWQADPPHYPQPVHGHVWLRVNGSRSWQCECAREDAQRICSALAAWDKAEG